MRIIPVALFVILFLIIGIPVLGIEWLIGKISKKTMDYSSLRIVQWAFKVIIGLPESSSLSSVRRMFRMSRFFLSETTEVILIS